MKLTVRGHEVYLGTGGRDPDPERRSVVFVHGAALDHTVWTMFARYFIRHGFNALAVDLPGHGRSEGPALTRVEALADWLGEVLDAAGIEQAALVGHSLGALVCLRAAARGRASALAMVGVGYPMTVAEGLLSAAREDDHAAFDMITIWGHGPAAQLGGFSVPGIWMTGSQLRLNERTAPGVLYADLSACNDYDAGLEDARAVHCPTLLVLGERDLMTPVRAARGIAEAIEGSLTRVLPGAGHALMAEQPNAVLDALAAWSTR